MERIYKNTWVYLVYNMVCNHQSQIMEWNLVGRYKKPTMTGTINHTIDTYNDAYFAEQTYITHIILKKDIGLQNKITPEEFADHIIQKRTIVNYDTLDPKKPYVTQYIVKLRPATPP